MLSSAKSSILFAALCCLSATANAGPTPAGVPKWHAQSGIRITINGQKSGLFKPVYAHSFSYSVISPRDPASGLPTGQRQHNPIKFTKLIDEVTPMLFQSLVTNENLMSVKIEFIGLDKSVNTTITLTNANLSKFEPHAQAIIADKPLVNAVAPTFNQLEDIELVFQKIEISSANGAVTASDDWEVRN